MTIYKWILAGCILSGGIGIIPGLLILIWYEMLDRQEQTALTKVHNDLQPDDGTVSKLQMLYRAQQAKPMQDSFLGIEGIVTKEKL